MSGRDRVADVADREHREAPGLFSKLKINITLACGSRHGVAGLIMLWPHVVNYCKYSCNGIGISMLNLLRLKVTERSLRQQYFVYWYSAPITDLFQIRYTSIRRRTAASELQRPGLACTMLRDL